MSFIYLKIYFKNKYDHSLLSSTAPPPPAVQPSSLACCYFSHLLSSLRLASALLCSQHSNQDSHFEMKVWLFYSYVQNSLVVFRIISSKCQNITVPTRRPSIIFVAGLSDYMSYSFLLGLSHTRHVPCTCWVQSCFNVLRERALLFSLQNPQYSAHGGCSHLPNECLLVIHVFDNSLCVCFSN